MSSSMILGIADPSGAAATWRVKYSGKKSDLYTPASTASEYRLQGNQPKIQNAYNYKKQVITGIHGLAYDQQNDDNYWQSKQLLPNILRPLGSGIKNAAIINEGVYNINPIGGTNMFGGGDVSVASGINPTNYSIVNTSDIEDRLRANAVPANDPLSAAYAQKLASGARIDPNNVEGDALLNNFRSESSVLRNAKSQVYNTSAIDAYQGDQPIYASLRDDLMKMKDAYKNMTPQAMMAHYLKGERDSQLRNLSMAQEGKKRTAEDVAAEGVQDNADEAEDNDEEDGMPESTSDGPGGPSGGPSGGPGGPSTGPSGGPSSQKAIQGTKRTGFTNKTPFGSIQLDTNSNVQDTTNARGRVVPLGKNPLDASKNAILNITPLKASNNIGRNRAARSMPKEELELDVARRVAASKLIKTSAAVKVNRRGSAESEKLPVIASSSLPTDRPVVRGEIERVTLYERGPEGENVMDLENKFNPVSAVRARIGMGKSKLVSLSRNLKDTPGLGNLPPLSVGAELANSYGDGTDLFADFMRDMAGMNNEDVVDHLRHIHNMSDEQLNFVAHNSATAVNNFAAQFNEIGNTFERVGNNISMEFHTESMIEDENRVESKFSNASKEKEKEDSINQTSLVMSRVAAIEAQIQKQVELSEKLMEQTNRRTEDETEKEKLRLKAEEADLKAKQLELELEKLKALEERARDKTFEYQKKYEDEQALRYAAESTAEKERAAASKYRERVKDLKEQVEWDKQDIENAENRQDMLGAKMDILKQQIENLNNQLAMAKSGPLRSQTEIQEINAKLNTLGHMVNFIGQRPNEVHLHQNNLHYSPHNDYTFNHTRQAIMFGTNHDLYNTHNMIGNGGGGGGPTIEEPGLIENGNMSTQHALNGCLSQQLSGAAPLGPTDLVNVNNNEAYQKEVEIRLAAELQEMRDKVGQVIKSLGVTSDEDLHTKEIFKQYLKYDRFNQNMDTLRLIGSAAELVNKIGSFTDEYGAQRLNTMAMERFHFESAKGLLSGVSLHDYAGILNGLIDIKYPGMLYFYEKGEEPTRDLADIPYFNYEPAGFGLGYLATSTPNLEEKIIGDFTLVEGGRPGVRHGKRQKTSPYG